jgi:hypothetical protein
VSGSLFEDALGLAEEIEASWHDPSPYNEGPWEHTGDAARDVERLIAGLREAEKALAVYESAVMGTLARLPNHWQQYRDLLELGEGVREARKIGGGAFDRWISRV